MVEAVYEVTSKQMEKNLKPKKPKYFDAEFFSVVAKRTFPRSVGTPVEMPVRAIYVTIKKIGKKQIIKQLFNPKSTLGMVVVSPALFAHSLYAAMPFWQAFEDQQLFSPQNKLFG